jgi:hypothetical protein
MLEMFEMELWIISRAFVEGVRLLLFMMCFELTSGLSLDQWLCGWLYNKRKDRKVVYLKRKPLSFEESTS